MYPVSPVIFLWVTLTLAYISYLISSTRLIYRWRYKTRQHRTPDFSPFVNYKDRHPKRYLCQMSLFILVTFTTTTVLAVLTIIKGEHYTTMLAAWIIVACCFHEAVISIIIWQISMEFFKKWHIWSSFAVASVLLLVGVVIHILEISNYGLILAKVSPSCYHLYFIWEWINVVAAVHQTPLDTNSSKAKTYLLARIMLTLPAFVFLPPSSDDSTLMGTAATFTAYDVFLSASLVPGDIQQSSEMPYRRTAIDCQSLTRRCQYSLSCNADLEIETLEPTLASLSRDSELATETFPIGQDSKPSGKNAAKLAAFGCMVLQHLHVEDAGLSDELEALKDPEAMLRPETGLILLFVQK
ncbi:hypothetical protein FGRA07_11719 [Fusarium graminearum]|nr:hypothetical protein FGRA07_11719 [Fusarium graminearum]